MTRYRSDGSPMSRGRRGATEIPKQEEFRISAGIILVIAALIPLAYGIYLYQDAKGSQEACEVARGIGGGCPLFEAEHTLRFVLGVGIGFVIAAIGIARRWAEHDEVAKAKPLEDRDQS